MALELDMKKPRAGLVFNGLAQGLKCEKGQILKTHYPLVRTWGNEAELS